MGVGIFSGCEDSFLGDWFEGDDDEEISVQELPPAALAYIEENYPNSSIEEAEREEEDGQIIYEVELDTGEELIFDAGGNFLGMEEDDDD